MKHYTKQPEHLPMILRNFRRAKVDARAGHPQFFVPLYDGNRALAVYTFDLYFADTYRRYHGEEYIRARDERYAKRLIRKRYPHIVKYVWDDLQ